MVESILTEALGAETGIVDMDHLVGASMKHTIMFIYGMPTDLFIIINLKLHGKRG